MSLTTGSIFNKLNSTICLVRSKDEYEGTGFFLQNGADIYVATCVHNLVHSENHQGETVLAFPQDKDLKVIIDKQEYPASLAYPYTPAIAKLQKLFDLCLLKMDKNHVPACVPMIDPSRDRELIAIGQKVYFGGFPLNQQVQTVHKGYISSVEKTAFGVLNFTIDGTVVPGNSGGPVVVRDGLQIKVIGVITSEVANIDQYLLQMHEITRKIREISRYKILEANPEDDIPGYGVMYPYIENGKKRYINESDLVMSSFQAMFQNLSTGIGRAISITHLPQMFDPAFREVVMRDDFLVPEIDSFFIGRKRNGIPVRKLHEHLRDFGFRYDPQRSKHAGEEWWSDANEAPRRDPPHFVSFNRGETVSPGVFDNVVQCSTNAASLRPLIGRLQALSFQETHGNAHLHQWSLQNVGTIEYSSNLEHDFDFRKIDSQINGAEVKAKVTENLAKKKFKLVSSDDANDLWKRDKIEIPLPVQLESIDKSLFETVNTLLATAHEK